jgi:hypothetical protein
MSEVAKTLASLKAALLSGDVVIGTLVDGGKSINSLENAVFLNGPKGFDPKDYAPQGVCSLEKFFEVAEELIEFGQSLTSNDPNKYVKMVGDYVDIDFAHFNGEVITHKLIRREPGKMDANGTGRPQRESTFHREIRSPHFPNKVLSIKTRPIDHVVEFTCYSRIASVASERALWLERLFVNYAWVFKVAGVERFHFEYRSADNYRTTAGQPVYERCLRFFVRLTEVQIDIDPEIKNIFATGGIYNNVNE